MDQPSKHVIRHHLDLVVVQEQVGKVGQIHKSVVVQG